MKDRTYPIGYRVIAINTETPAEVRLGTVVGEAVSDGACCDPECCSGGPTYYYVVRWDDGVEERVADWEIEGLRT